MKPLALDAGELVDFKTIKRKHIRPVMVDGKWDGISVFYGKKSKHKLSPREKFFAAVMQKLIDHEYEFTEPPPKKEKGVCFYPKCNEIGSHPHHVVYRPPVVKLLCPQHHRDITVVNINQAEKIYGKLSNKHRFWAWGAWLRGELQPQMTANAERWLDRWKS